MPIYNVVNKETGEKQEFQMSISSYEKWREENPDWDKDWSAGIAGTTYGLPRQTDGLKKSCPKSKQHIPKQTLAVTPNARKETKDTSKHSN